MLKGNKRTNIARTARVLCCQTAASKHCLIFNMEATTSCLLVYLTACALHGFLPEKERLSGVNLSDLFDLAKHNSMSALVAYSLKSIGIDDKKWADVYLKAIRKSLMLDAECGELMRVMEQNKIWYMPLKGTVLKDFYPSVGLRERADVDILFDGEHRVMIRDYFHKRDYKVCEFNKNIDDVYTKEPIYNFEMHTALFGENHDSAWKDYYTDVKSRIIKDENHQFAYHFSDEDFYIYMMTHAYKHNQAKETGLRSLADCYVYIQEKNEGLNWCYIEEELQKLGIAEWEKGFRALAIHVFEEPWNRKTLSLGEQKQLDRLICFGAYGNLEIFIRDQLMTLQADKEPITKAIRRKYIYKRIFPSKELIMDKYSITIRYKWLVPVTWTLRLIKALLFERKRIVREFFIVRKVESKE